VRQPGPACTRPPRAAWLTVLLPALLCATAGGAPPAQPAVPASRPAYGVRLVSPAEGAYISGPTTLEAEASFPAADPVARVEFYADDVRVAVVARPPFRATWDAGPEFEPHLVRAVALSASGERAAAEVRTRRLVPGQRLEVSVVTVYATVRDKGRGYVTNLKASDFVLEENGVPQTITYFSREARPACWAILLDVSASMEGRRIDTARKAALIFIDSLAPQDRATVLTFSDVVDSTELAASDRGALRDKVLSARAGGGTALYDALVEATERLREVEGKKALLLLSDGRDQGMDGYGPGSTHTFEEALEHAQRAEVAVYAVGLGEDLDQQLDFRRRRSLKDLLESLAGDTGGRAYFVRSEGGLREIFHRVAEEVRLQYSLGYTSTHARRDGTWRSITLRTKQTGQEVTARRGYFAPKGES